MKKHSVEGLLFVVLCLIVVGLILTVFAVFFYAANDDPKLWNYWGALKWGLGVLGVATIGLVAAVLLWKRVD
jgi:hypothetical protein